MIEEWRAQALCAKREYQHLDFYEEYLRDRTECARVCARCPVAYECLDYALTNQELSGVWGGHFFNRGNITRISLVERDLRGQRV